MAMVKIQFKTHGTDKAIEKKTLQNSIYVTTCISKSLGYLNIIVHVYVISDY